MPSDSAEKLTSPPDVRWGKTRATRLPFREEFCWEGIPGLIPDGVK